MFTLIQCDVKGDPVQFRGVLSEEITANCLASADLYRRIGFVEPWVSYLAVDSGTVVGGGAFVGPPKDNRVEIAYYTLKEFEGKGFGMNIARHLVAIAIDAEPAITVSAFTLPAPNASNRILIKLEFKFFGLAHDSDAGEVWEWRA